MKCCLCKSEIEKHRHPNGDVYWDQGHNPAPVMEGDDDRCCDACNATIVIPTRLNNLFHHTITQGRTNNTH